MARGEALVRMAVVVTATCLSFVGLSLADNARAAIRQPISIASQGLESALQELARKRDVQVVYRTEVIGSRKSRPVSGDFTLDEALKQLLGGTGLTYQYLDEQTVTIVPVGAGGSGDVKSSGKDGGAMAAAKLEVSDKEAESGAAKSEAFWDRFRVAQAETNSGGRDAQDKESLQEIVVMPEILIKGSNVFNVDVKRTQDDEQPYYILDSKQIQESGAVSVDDFLKQRLPMNVAARSPSQGSLSGATSSINLRGLGTNETLVLIDGRRSASVPISGQSIQPDLNAIPLSAIERIEVLPSSASAIYGGAAMGGVVNVILKKNYEGGQFTYSYENTFEGHAPIDTVSATYGLTLEGGKTRVMLSGQYSDGTVLRLRDRPELVSQGYANILARDPAFFFSSGPSQPYLGATPNIGSSDGHTGLTFKGSGTALGSPIATIAPGASAATPSTVIPGQWNSTPPPTAQPYAGLLEPLGVVPTIKSLMASLHRDLGSHLGFFSEFSTQSNSSNTPAALNPIYGTFSVPASSPANPFNQSVAVSIPNTAGSPNVTNEVTHSVTVGMLARLPADWSSELDYTWSKNIISYSYTAHYDTTAFKAALANGTINPFLDTLAHPIDLTSYLTPQSANGGSTLNDLGLRVSGPIGSLPAGHPTLTVGLEHRKEGGSDFDAYMTYALSPSQNTHVRYFGQSQSTNSAYAEAQVPLLGPSNAIPVVHSVDLQLAGRSERYTVNARTPFANLAPDGSVVSGSPPQGVFQEVKYTSTNPTIGLKYKPIEDLTFRASFAKAFLPPTANQFLPDPRTLITQTIVDPVNGQPYSVQTMRGGNPNLRPQTARHWDFGVILEPQEEALRGLRLNLEYYQTVQPDYITQPSPQEILANPAYASRVTRDPTTGVVKKIDLAYLNATDFRTAGWDLTIDYQKSTAIGTFSLHAIGSAIDYDKRQYTISGALQDYAGFPLEGGEAKLKGNATLTWSYRAWTLAWTATYFGSYKQGYGSPDSPYALQYGAFTQYTNAQGGFSIPSQTYHDLVASYDLRKTPLSFVSGLKIQLGVKNLFNKVPPFDAAYLPYYSTYGDARLRDYWVSVSARF